MEKRYLKTCLFGPQRVNSFWRKVPTWRNSSRTTLAQVKACCLTASSHYLSQYWHTVNWTLGNKSHHNTKLFLSRKCLWKKCHLQKRWAIFRPPCVKYHYLWASRLQHNHPQKWPPSLWVCTKYIKLVGSTRSIYNRGLFYHPALEVRHG